MYEGDTIKYLFPAEKEALFHVIQSDTGLHSKRNQAIFLLAEYCGMRASEIGLLRLTDLKLERKEIYIRRLKRSNNNTLRLINTAVFSAVSEYLQLRTMLPITSDFLFISQKGNPISRKVLDELMKKYCQLANIPPEKAHFHALKHTCAVSLAERGFDTKEIQFWIGHKSIQNTEIYFQFTSRQQDLLYQKLSSSIPNA